jgi:uncharacterized membrane protein
LFIDLKMTEKPIYERIEGEPQKAYEAFCVYRDMGKTRSIDRVRDEIGKTSRHLQTLSYTHKWVERVEAYDLDQEAIARQILVEENREAYREKLRRYNKEDEEIGRANRAIAVAGLAKLRKFIDNLDQKDITMRNAHNLAKIVDTCFNRGEHSLNNAYAIDKILQTIIEDEKE